MGSACLALCTGLEESLSISQLLCPLQLMVRVHVLCVFGCAVPAVLKTSSFDQSQHALRYSLKTCCQPSWTSLGIRIHELGACFPVASSPLSRCPPRLTPFTTLMRMCASMYVCWRDKAFGWGVAQAILQPIDSSSAAHHSNPNLVVSSEGVRAVR